MADIEYEVRGLDSLEVRVRAEGAEVRDDIIDGMRHALEAAHAHMMANVPRGETNRLAQSIDVDPIVFRPGGLGGGGFYEGGLSVGRGIDYLAALVEGSGEHGHTGQKITAKQGNIILGSSKGAWYRDRWTSGGAGRNKRVKPMHFQKRGEDVFITWQSGQKAQDEWLVQSQQIASFIIADSINRI